MNNNLRSQLREATVLEAHDDERMEFFQNVALFVAGGLLIALIAAVITMVAVIPAISGTPFERPATLAIILGGWAIAKVPPDSWSTAATTRCQASCWAPPPKGQASGS